MLLSLIDSFYEEQSYIKRYYKLIELSLKFKYMSQIAFTVQPKRPPI